MLLLFVATVFASGQIGRYERVVRATHIALGFAGLLFWNGVLCHFLPPGREKAPECVVFARALQLRGSQKCSRHPRQP
jgi:hypothetical protein